MIHTILHLSMLHCYRQITSKPKNKEASCLKCVSLLTLFNGIKCNNSSTHVITPLIFSSSLVPFSCPPKAPSTYPHTTTYFKFALATNELLLSLNPISKELRYSSLHKQFQKDRETHKTFKQTPKIPLDYKRRTMCCGSTMFFSLIYFFLVAWQ